MQTEKPQPEDKRIMPETRFLSCVSENRVGFVEMPHLLSHLFKSLFFSSFFFFLCVCVGGGGGGGKGGGGRGEERRAAPMMSFIFSIFIYLKLMYILDNLIESSSL